MLIFYHKKQPKKLFKNINILGNKKRLIKDKINMGERGYREYMD